MKEVGIVGSGPAGIAAAIYLKRAGFEPLVFEKDTIGGLLKNAHLVENYPGFPKGISGDELCKLFKEQLNIYNIKIHFEKITKIILHSNSFVLQSNKDIYTVKSLIICTGTSPNRLEYDQCSYLLGKRIFYEIYHVIPLLNHHCSCIILGGGDAAFDYALNLADRKIKSSIFFRSNTPHCLSLLENRARLSKYIKLYSNSKIKKVSENNENRLEISFTINKSNFSIASDFLLIAYGRYPERELIQNELEKDNIPGFYFAGDVVSGQYRQVGIAVGQGIKAAMKINEYLRGTQT